MKNSMKDLNDHLFAQLERLGEEGMTKEQVAMEVERGKAISAVAKVITENAKLEIEAQKLALDTGTYGKNSIRILGRNIIEGSQDEKKPIALHR